VAVATAAIVVVRVIGAADVWILVALAFLLGVGKTSTA